MNEISKRVKVLREEMGLSVKDMAEQLDCTRDYVYKIESGKRSPSKYFLKELERLESIAPRK